MYVAKRKALISFAGHREVLFSYMQNFGVLMTWLINVRNKVCALFLTLRVRTNVNLNVA